VIRLARRGCGRQRSEYRAPRPRHTQARRDSHEDFPTRRYQGRSNRRDFCRSDLPSARLARFPSCRSRSPTGKSCSSTHSALEGSTRSASSCASCRGNQARRAGSTFLITKTAGSRANAFLARLAGSVHPAAPRAWPGGQRARTSLPRGDTTTSGYSFERVQGVRNMLLGGSGIFIDKFQASGGRRGRLDRRGRAKRVRGLSSTVVSSSSRGPAGWLYKDPSVTLSSHSLRPQGWNVRRRPQS